MNVQTYQISGMTCGNCRASVEEKLSAIQDVGRVEVDLEKGEAKVSSFHDITIERLQEALPSKYTIAERNVFSETVTETKKETSDLKQLFPLFLIFFYITAASVFMNANPWSTNDFMLDFMGLFYIVFSFFKFLDYKGFPESFKMYDPLAKAIPIYGWAYPFIEMALGLLFLFRFEVNIALVATLVILGITTIGVTRSLLSKKSIQCACLGTALRLPMTKATFIENTIMIIMAVWMLAKSL